MELIGKDLLSMTHEDIYNLFRSGKKRILQEKQNEKYNKELSDELEHHPMSRTLE